MKPRYLLCISAVLYLSLAGCTRHKTDEESGRKEIPVAAKFDELFQKSSHKIGHHRGIGEGLYFGSKGIAYDRYVVSTTFKVKIEGKEKPKKESTARIGVNEYNSTESGFSGSQIGIIEESDWLQFDSIDQIFSHLDYAPKKDSPTDDIDQVLTMW